MLKKETINKPFKNDFVLKFSAIVFFTMLFITIGYYKFVFKKKEATIKSGGGQATIRKVNEKDLNSWIIYERQDYGFLIQYPPRLIINNLGKAGGYELFIRLDAPLGSNEKGVAVGLSSKPLENETKRIKEELEKENIGILQSENDFEYKGTAAKKLYYKPKDSAVGEDRIIVIFNRKGFTYSISTSPELTDRILQGFSFI